MAISRLQRGKTGDSDGKQQATNNRDVDEQTTARDMRCHAVAGLAERSPPLQRSSRSRINYQPRLYLARRGPYITRQHTRAILSFVGCPHV